MGSFSRVAREIFFRGKLVDKYQNAGAWKQGSLLVTVDGGHHVFVLPSFMFEVQAGTVGEYIGFRDMDGVRVFEGDVVSHGKKLYVVRHSPVKAGFELCPVGCGLGLFLMDLADSRIAGNIYDNPELIGGDK
jgi:hypothetical protein